jgi:glycosyltransferase involved in cell wall biosynthesis
MDRIIQPDSTAVLSYCDVSQPVNGRSRRMHALLRTLGESAVLIQPKGTDPEFPHQAFPLNLGKRKLLINWGIFNFFCPINRRTVHTALKILNPPNIVITSIWDYAALKPFRHIPMMLDAHNVDAVPMAEQFGPNHPFTRMVASWERRVVNAMQHICCCSKDDRQLFIERYQCPPEKITVVPNGVDTDSFAEISQTDLPSEQEDQLKDHTVLFFMGKLDYQPNREALRFLRDTIWPELDKQADNRFRLLVCGGPVPTETYPDAFIFTDRVEDLRPYIHRADICLAPLFSGSGTRFKIIEYLACGRATVSTPKGAEGLGCESGKNLLLADGQPFAQAILDLAENPNRRQELGRSGQDYIRKTLDWQVIAPRWLAALDKLGAREHSK